MPLPLAPWPWPAMTRTVSPFLTFMSEHLRRQRNDLHVALVTQLTTDRPEDAGAARVTVGLDQHRGVLVEFDVGTVGTALLLDGAHDDGLDHVALLDTRTRDRVLDGGDDDVADARVPAGGPTEHPDAQDLLGAGVVGDAETGLLLNHCSPPSHDTRGVPSALFRFDPAPAAAHTRKDKRKYGQIARLFTLACGMSRTRRRSDRARWWTESWQDFRPRQARA